MRDNIYHSNDETQCVAEKKETIHDLLDVIEKQQDAMLGDILLLRDRIKGASCKLPDGGEEPQTTPNCLFEQVRLTRNQNEKIGSIIREIVQTI